MYASTLAGCRHVSRYVGKYVSCMSDIPDTLSFGKAHAEIWVLLGALKGGEGEAGMSRRVCARHIESPKPNPMPETLAQNPNFPPLKP